jgi:hypothetical protein
MGLNQILAEPSLQELTVSFVTKIRVVVYNDLAS